MKSNRWINWAMLLLFLNVVLTMGLTIQYVRAMRQLPQLQAAKSQIGYNLNVMRDLLQESMEYGKRNPAILPLLQITPPRPPAAPNSPTPAKPSR